jgi:hypothetical protein
MPLDIFLNCVHVKSYVSHITMTSIFQIAGELVSAARYLDYKSRYIETEPIIRSPGDINFKSFLSYLRRFLNF